MAYAVPPGEDDDLLNVLKLEHLPPWVNDDDLYRDKPQVVAAEYFQATDGAGRPAYYVLTPLRPMGARKSRTVGAVGAGHWKVEKTTRLPTAGEASAPCGTCANLSFLCQPPNGGPEGRNGWLMKEYLLHHAPGTPAGPALCKLYFKKSAVAASTASAAAAAASAAAAAAPARPLRLPASTPCATRFNLKKPAAAPTSTAAAATSTAAAAKAAAPARPLRLPASTPCATRFNLKKPAAAAAKAAAPARPLRLPAYTPCGKFKLKKLAATAASTAAAVASTAATVKAAAAARPLRLPASTPCAKAYMKQPAAEAPSTAAAAKAAALLVAAAAPSLPGTSQPARPLRPQLSSIRSTPPHLCTTPEREPPGPSSTPGRRWVLVQTEATTPAPQPQHDRSLKRIYEILQVDEVEVEDGEVVEQGQYLKKRAKICCDESSYMIVRHVDFRKLDAH